MKNFKIELDSEGVALVTFDVPGRSMNTLTMEAVREVGEIAARAKTDDAIKGLIFTSGKANGFCAGADIGEMNAGGGVLALGGDPADDAALKAQFETAFTFNKAFRALETCGKPVAAALEGLALGGGLELVLACHYRVAADNPKIKLGLPEAKIGLLPGGGGTQRLPRLIGAQNAAMMILQGEEKSPQEAKALGFVNELAAPGAAVEAARAWLKTNPKPVAPWDVKGYRVKDNAQSPAGFMLATGANAMVSKQTSLNYPAQLNILKCLYEGLQLPIDAALRVESRYFVNTAKTPQAKAMIRSLFVSMQELSKGANRPKGPAKAEFKKVAVLGAGMMGAGVAYVQAMAGIETVLIDRDQESADKGKAHCKSLLDKRVSRGKLEQAKADAILALIKPTADYAEIKGADLVIEAVFENKELKAEVTKKAEAQLAETAIFGSNTSTLPITSLAEASARPNNFIGIHFFSPVDKMGLVEIILGKDTSEETLARSIDYVLKIKKTPIVVNDSRGFYTSRCFSTYVREGIAMLAEGIKPAIIENCGRQTGMPRAPLEMSDDVAIDLAWKIAQETKKALGPAYQESPPDKILETMVEKLGRYGRKNAKGFYEYPEGGKKYIWPGLSELVETRVFECPPPLRDEYKKRLLYIQAVETARCFEEGVITDPRDADIGSILGWGFAPWTGGVISLIDGIGVKKFVDECDALAAKYGERFKPNALLRDMAAKGESFYGRFGANVKQAA